MAEKILASRLRGLIWRNGPYLYYFSGESEDINQNIIENMRSLAKVHRIIKVLEIDWNDYINFMKNKSLGVMNTIYLYFKGDLIKEEFNPDLKKIQELFIEGVKFFNKKVDNHIENVENLLMRNPINKEFPSIITHKKEFDSYHQRTCWKKRQRLLRKKLKFQINDKISKKEIEIFKNEIEPSKLKLENVNISLKNDKIKDQVFLDHPSLVNKIVDINDEKILRKKDKKTSIQNGFKTKNLQPKCNSQNKKVISQSGKNNRKIRIPKNDINSVDNSKLRSMRERKINLKFKKERNIEELMENSISKNIRISKSRKGNVMCFKNKISMINTLKKDVNLSIQNKRMPRGRKRKYCIDENTTLLKDKIFDGKMIKLPESEEKQFLETNQNLKKNQNSENQYNDNQNLNISTHNIDQKLNHLENKLVHETDSRFKNQTETVTVYNNISQKILEKEDSSKINNNNILRNTITPWSAKKYFINKMGIQKSENIKTSIFKEKICADNLEDGKIKSTDTLGNEELKYITDISQLNLEKPTMTENPSKYYPIIKDNPIGIDRKQPSQLDYNKILGFNINGFHDQFRNTNFNFGIHTNSVLTQYFRNAFEALIDVEKESQIRKSDNILDMSVSKNPTKRNISRRKIKNDEQKIKCPKDNKYQKLKPEESNEKTLVTSNNSQTNENKFDINKSHIKIGNIFFAVNSYKYTNLPKSPKNVLNCNYQPKNSENI